MPPQATLDSGAVWPPGAGNVALDLVNTSARRRGGRVDLLGAPGAVAVWLEHVGADPAGHGARAMRDPPVARELRAEARALRDAIDRIVSALAVARTPAPHDTDALNRVLAAWPSTLRLSLGDGAPRIERASCPNVPLGLLGPVAKAAAELIVDPPGGRLRRCASDACALWFVDTSRNGRRRWCSMATCGNRAKAARHQRRHGRGGAEPTG